MIQVLGSYPSVTVLAAAFYVLLLSMAVPSWRRRIEPYTSHPAPPTPDYLYGFDLFRGLAALLIALGHAWNMNRPIFDSLSHSSLFWAYLLGHAAKAVPIFAVLSGFLIYRSALKIDGLAALRRYTLRRIFRIYPVYFVGTMLALAFGLYVGKEKVHGAFNFFVADLFMLSPFGWHKSAQVVTWSLYIEEMFYVILPIVLILVTPRRMKLFSLLGLLVLLAANYPSREFGIWKYFLFGILASEIEPRLKDKLNLAIIAFCCGVAILVLDFRSGDTDLFGLLPKQPGGQTFTLGFGCALILVSLSNLRGFSRALNVLPLKMLGAISFSVFITHRFLIYYNFPITLRLEHDPSLRFAANHAVAPMPGWYIPLVLIPAVLAVALICFWLVERPGIILGRKLAKRIKG